MDIDEGACTFINCTITGNKNKKLFYVDEGSLTFINCTIRGNDGKIYNEKGSLSFYLCDKLTNLSLPKSVKVFEANKMFESNQESGPFQKITIKWDGATEEQMKKINEDIMGK